VTPLWLYEVVGFVLGLLFGSFLNVCISRLPKHESIVKPRSRCPECGSAIRWYDNIPVLSWLILRGRCRDCRQPIPWRYPVVELSMAVWLYRPTLFLYGVWEQHKVWEFGRPRPGDEVTQVLIALSLAILGFFLIGLIVMDWQTHLLPNAFTLNGIAIALFLLCLQAIFLAPGEGQIVLNTTHQLRLSSPGSFAAKGNVFMTGPEALIWGRVAAILGAAGLLLLIRWLYQFLRHREGLGLGDVKLLAMIAAFLGFWSAVLALFVGVLTATAYALFLLARGRANHLTRLPLGSFLAVGGLVAALFGTRLIDIYTTMLR
jgi:leader peptidase (prepilin peptidase) / N-methyltransferase